MTKRTVDKQSEKQKKRKREKRNVFICISLPFCRMKGITDIRVPTNRHTHASSQRAYRLRLLVLREEFETKYIFGQRMSAHTALNDYFFKFSRNRMANSWNFNHRR